jgi:hypothetical protein
LFVHRSMYALFTFFILLFFCSSVGSSNRPIFRNMLCIYLYIYIYENASIWIWLYLPHMTENIQPLSF